MWTPEQKKAFALEHLRGYYNNPETCGFNGENCDYFTEDGKKCIFGKFLLNPEKFKGLTMNADEILARDSEVILQPEVVGAFSPAEWRDMQRVHDAIARQKEIPYYVKNLGWFTMDELTKPVS